MSVCNSSLQLKLRCCINTHPLRKKNISKLKMRSSWWLGELHLQRRAEIGRQMQAKHANMCPNQRISWNQLQIRSVLRIWEGGAGAEIEFAELFVGPKLHIPKKCAIYIYIHTRMKVLIRHSAHFAPSCSIAHSPLLRQSSISYCIQIQCSYDKLGQV